MAAVGSLPTARMDTPLPGFPQTWEGERDASLDVLKGFIGLLAAEVPSAPVDVFLSSPDDAALPADIVDSIDNDLNGCAQSIDEFGQLFEPVHVTCPEEVPGPGALATPQPSTTKRCWTPAPDPDPAPAPTATANLAGPWKKRKFTIPSVPTLAVPEVAEPDVKPDVKPDVAAADVAPTVGVCDAPVACEPPCVLPPVASAGGALDRKDSIRVLLRRGGLSAREYRRLEAIPRFLKKRGRRDWTKAKAAMYRSRTAAASSRRRVKGQFSTTPNMWRSFADIKSL